MFNDSIDGLEGYYQREWRRKFTRDHPEIIQAYNRQREFKKGFCEVVKRLETPEERSAFIRDMAGEVEGRTNES